jgi:phage gpG-like protein
LIDIQLTGNLPRANANLEPAMADAEQIMFQSVLVNLIEGGRPPYQVKNPTGRTPLLGSGKMAAGLRSEHDQTSATVYMDDSVRSAKGFFYPEALHFGAKVPPVEGKLMVFEFAGQKVFTYKRKGFYLGPFPFMLFQEEDKERIIQIIADAIFEQD